MQIICYLRFDRRLSRNIAAIYKELVLHLLFALCMRILSKIILSFIDFKVKNVPSKLSIGAIAALFLVS